MSCFGAKLVKKWFGKIFQIFPHYICFERTKFEALYVLRQQHTYMGLFLQSFTKLAKQNKKKKDFAEQRKHF